MLKINEKQISRLTKRLEGLKSSRALAERRSEERSVANVVAAILPNDSDVEFPCKILNMNNSGAKLLLDNSRSLEGRAMLIIDTTERKSCRIAWQRGSEMGITF